MNPMRTIRVVDPTDVLWKRVGAFLIDEALYLGSVGLVALAFRGWLGSFVTVLYAIAAWLAFFVVLQGVTGASPGKHLCGLRVVTADGRPCGPAKAAVRSAAWIVDGFPYILPLTGYTAAISDQHGQRLGDRAAATYVIDREYLGQAPYAVAFPGDGSEPYLLTTRAPYLDGTAVNPLKQGTVAAEVAALHTGPAPRTPGKPGNDPFFDPELRAYKRWDAVHHAWAIFDEDTRQWRPAPVTATRG